LIEATKDYLRIGDFADVKILDSQEYDLIGELNKK
jgi:hypothetical protein